MTLQKVESNKTVEIEETFIISRTDDGFRVYSPLHPTQSFIVSGSEENPLCTCLDFQEHIEDLAWRCRHIEAMLAQLKSQNRQEETQAPAPQPAAQGSGNGTTKPKRRSANGRSNGHAQMLLKRSVSPDGRIDSLSVEFACPVDKASEDEVKDKAATCLRLQAEIVTAFLKENGKPAKPERHEEPAAPAVPAEIVNVGGMDGQWGRRLFLNIQANGRRLRLYGGKKHLAECLAAAGRAIAAERIAEGMRLNLPCRIVTVPSPDGQYLNVERVLPAGTASGRA